MSLVKKIAVVILLFCPAALQAQTIQSSQSIQSVPYNAAGGQFIIQSAPGQTGNEAEFCAQNSVLPGLHCAQIGCYFDANGNLSCSGNSYDFVTNPFTRLSQTTAAGGGQLGAEIWVDGIKIWGGTGVGLNDALATFPNQTPVIAHLGGVFVQASSATSYTVDMDCGGVPGAFCDPFENSSGGKLALLQLPCGKAGGANFVFTNSPLHRTESQMMTGCGSGANATNQGTTIAPGASFPLPIPALTGSVTAQAFGGATQTANPYDAGAPSCPAGGTSALSNVAYNVGMAVGTPSGLTEMPLQPAAWAASTQYGTGQLRLDSNNNVERVLTPGTSAGSAPAWIGGQSCMVQINSVTASGTTVTARYGVPTGGCGSASGPTPNTLVSGNWVVIQGFSGTNAPYNTQGAQISSVTGTTFVYTAPSTPPASASGTPNATIAYTVTVDGGGMVYKNLGADYITAASVTPASLGGGKVQCIAVQIPTLTGTAQATATQATAYGSTGGVAAYLGGGTVCTGGSNCASPRTAITVTGWGGAPPPGEANLTAVIDTLGPCNLNAGNCGSTPSTVGQNPIDIGSWGRDYNLDCQGFGFQGGIAVGWNLQTLGAGCIPGANVAMQENGGWENVNANDATGAAEIVVEGFQSRNSESSARLHMLFAPPDCPQKGCLYAPANAVVFPTWGLLWDAVTQTHCENCFGDLAFGDNNPPPLGFGYEEIVGPTSETVASSTSMFYQLRRHYECSQCTTSTQARPFAFQLDNAGLRGLSSNGGGVQLVIDGLDDDIGGSGSDVPAITINGACPGCKITGVKVPPSGFDVYAIQDNYNGYSTAVGKVEACYETLPSGGISRDCNNPQPYAMVTGGTGANITTFLTAAMAASPSVFIPCGSYTVTAGTTIPAAVRLWGGARNCVTLTFTAAGGPGFSITHGGATLEHLTLNGTNLTSGDVVDIASGLSNVTLAYDTIENATQGNGVTALSANQLIVDHTNFSGNGQDCLLYDLEPGKTAAGVKLTNNYCDDTAASVTGADVGLYVEAFSGTASALTDVLVSGNTVLYPGLGTHETDGIVELCNSSSNLITGAVITGNTIQESGASTSGNGIEESGCPQTNITGNWVSNAYVGIVIETAGATATSIGNIVNSSVANGGSSTGISITASAGQAQSVGDDVTGTFNYGVNLAAQYARAVGDEISLSSTTSANGIQVNASNVGVTGNTIQTSASSDKGILFSSGSQVSITNNNITGAANNVGIQFSQASTAGSVISGNTLNGQTTAGNVYHGTTSQAGLEIVPTLGTTTGTAIAPTISSGFGTSPSVVKDNGAFSFSVNVGTGGSASSGVIAMSQTAANGWSCSVADVTTSSSSVFLTKQTASSATTVTVTNYNTSGSATAWTASDVLQLNCSPF